MASSPVLGGDTSLLAGYVRLLQRRSGVVALVWLAIFAVGIVGVTHVFANLKLEARARGRQRKPAARFVHAAGVRCPPARHERHADPALTHRPLD